jgi:hypothetical protein
MKNAQSNRVLFFEKFEQTLIAYLLENEAIIYYDEWYIYYLQ